MWIYNFIYIISLVNFLFFYKVNNKKLEKIITKIILIILILVAGYRYHTGFDYNAYVSIFKALPDLNEIILGKYDIHGERLFLLLLKIVEKIGFEMRGVFLLISILTLGFTYLGLKQSNYFSFGIYIYISTFFLREGMGQIRAGLATAICFYALKYLNKKNNKFIFLILIASGIQTVGIFFLPLPFIIKLVNKSSAKIKIFFIIISILIGCFFSRNILLNLTSYISIDYFLKLKYSNYSYKVSFSLYQIYIVSIAMIFIYLQKKCKIKIYKINQSINIFILGVIFYFLFFNFSILAGRVSDLYFKIILLLYPYILRIVNNKILRLIFILFIIILNTYLYYNYLIDKKDDFIPYMYKVKVD